MMVVCLHPEQLLTLLLEQPTDDSVEMAVAFTKECGQTLNELSPKGIHGMIMSMVSEFTKLKLLQFRNADSKLFISH